MEKYDILIAGAGVTGSMLARQLSRYNLSVCVLEKENDVACGASKANSGIIHGGHDPVPGTLKAKLNSKGTPMLFEVCRQLNVPMKKNGSMVCAFTPEEEPVIDTLYSRGLENGIEGLKIISGDEARQLENNLSPSVTKALLIENSGIVCPYSLTIAAMGNAMDNGVVLKRNFEIIRIDKADKLFTVYSSKGEAVQGDYLINCAGCFSDKVAAMAGDGFFTIIPRAGEYMLMDKSEGGIISHTIFQTPGKEGKGILVTPTVHGNLLCGPTAQQVDSGNATQTTSPQLEKIQKLAAKSVPSVNFRQVITSFTGVRSSVEGGDFIIKMSDTVENLVHVAAIDSPGLSCCVSIAEYVIDILRDNGVTLEEKPDWDGTREDTLAFSKMNIEEKNRVIAENPAYGRIVCRCETVTEGEIIDAVRRRPGALDLDGVKRRTRSGMGRCQGGFCSPYIMKLIAQHTGQDMTQITKNGNGSYYVTHRL